jgi:hypothetical protein
MNDGIVVTALDVRANFGKLLRRVAEHRHREAWQSTRRFAQHSRLCAPIGSRTGGASHHRGGVRKQEDESVDRETNRPGHPGLPQNHAPMIPLRFMRSL